MISLRSLTRSFTGKVITGCVVSISITCGTVASLLYFNLPVLPVLLTFLIMVSVSALLIALVTKHYINTPVSQMLSILEQIGQGDTSGAKKLNAGKPVDCASIKKCGQSACKCFGKKTLCWVEVGSFAVEKQCPRAKSGIDCRTCDLFGAHGEIEELNSMVLSLANYIDIREVAITKVAEGDLSHNIIAASDKDRLGTALHKMVLSLKNFKTENDAQAAINTKIDWLKTGVGTLNESIRGDLSVETLCDNALKFYASYIGILVGAAYSLASEKRLFLAASFAFSHRRSTSKTINFGEGLVGQAADEKKFFILENVPNNFLRVSTGLGFANPKNIAIVPLVYNEEVMGVLELGSLKDFSEDDIALINQSAFSLAVSLHAATARRKVNELLDCTQSQAKELQHQQEELRQTNEELEERTELLEKQSKELKNQQEELQQTNEELEERTSLLDRQKQQIEIKNSDLSMKQKELETKAIELEQSSRYKSEFLANMSHELRTPLNSLLILSKLLEENKQGNLSEKQIQFATTINKSGNELLTLINDILDLSKVEAGKLQMNIDEMPVAIMCANMRRLFTHVAVEKGVQFEIEVCDDAPAGVRSDQMRVEQIIKNLLSNAFKFTDKGVVKLRFAKAPAGRGALEVSVRDSGIGIPAEKQQAVFQAFQQADGSTSRKYGGTGLGLSISLQLARALGGDIALESEPDKGSTFILYLPQSAPETHSQDGPRQDVPRAVPVIGAKSPSSPAQELEIAQDFDGETIPPPSPDLPDDRDTLEQGGKSILVVEDDLSFARILIDIVRERGFKAIGATDGKVGLALAKHYRPSAVLLDVMLPGMDGWGVMRNLKDDPDTRHIPVHFISCGDESIKGMRMGAVGYLTKPVDMAMLKGAFSRIEGAIAKNVRKILLVENSAGETLNITSLIENCGIELKSVSSAAEAIDILHKELYDCIILDLGLPDMSGFELLERIKEEEGDVATIPVIVHTARMLSEQEEKRLSVFAQSIIIKGAGSSDRLLDEVSLFLHLVERKMPPEQRERIRRMHSPDSIFEGKTVLVVDDDMRNVFSLTSVLEEKSLIVLSAENGIECLKMLDDNPKIDLILMDVMMPKMDGLEASRRIRANPKFKNIPIIALTAKAMKSDREACIAAGANDYLTKPIDIGKLFSALRVWLYNSKA